MNGSDGIDSMFDDVIDKGFSSEDEGVNDDIYEQSDNDIEQEDVVEGEDTEQVDDAEDPKVDEQEYEFEVDGVIKKLKESDLSSAIKAGERLPVLEQDLQHYNKIKPVLDVIRDSPLSRAILEYKTMNPANVSEDAILEDIYRRRFPDKAAILDKYTGQDQQQQEEEKPQFDTVEEIAEYYTQKTIREYVKPLEDKIRQYENNTNATQQREFVASVTRHNDSLFDKAASEMYGLSNTEYTDEHAKLFIESVNQLYPGVDITKVKFSEQQARTIIRNAFDGKVQNKKERSGARRLSSTGDLPNMLPGSKVNNRPAGNREVPRGGNYAGSREERLRSVDELFS